MLLLNNITKHNMAIGENVNMDHVQEAMILYFEQKINQLRNNQLSPQETRRWTDFYMEEMYRMNHVDENNENVLENNENIDISISGNPNTLKYFFLGWYIYEQLLANLNEINENQENQEEGKE